jgi:haloalkane dehalogenase
VTTTFRTPDERFAGLPDFPCEPRYREWDGMRLAHVDEGDGAPVVLFHGEPTWSFLWRKVIPPLLEAGHRCLAGDLPGFGRSDKPVDLAWYSYDAHTSAMRALFEELDLRGATVVVHDWGGPIGLRLAVELPERIDRIVMMDTGLFTGRQRMPDAWHQFRGFIERTEDPPVSMLIRGACASDPGEDVLAAYDAPFPEARAKAGVRAFPLMLPLSPDDPGAGAGQRVLEALEADERPMLMLWADGDPVIPPATGLKLAERLGREPPEPVEGASHFLQEDKGAEIGRRIAEWLG